MPWLKTRALVHPFAVGRRRPQALALRHRPYGRPVCHAVDALGEFSRWGSFLLAIAGVICQAR